MQVSNTVMVPIAVAMISACGVILASWISARKKNHEKLKDDNPTKLDGFRTSASASIRTGDALESNVAIGNNITQTIHGAVHHHINVAPIKRGPFGEKVASKPALKEICESFANAKQYDAVQIRKNYVGLDVSWPVSFFRQHPVNPTIRPVSKCGT